MLERIAQWIFWLISRVSITLVCIVAFQRLLAGEGYHINFGILVMGAVSLIVGVSAWTLLPNKKAKQKETSWGG
jgi:hypothetical protein